MRRYLPAIAALLLSATIVSGFSTAYPKAQAATRTVTGRVIDAGTLQRLSSVNVIASGHGIGTATEVGGGFQLHDVPDGATVIELRHPCYFGVQVTIPASGDVELELGLPFDRASLQRAGCGGLGARKK